MSFPDLGELPDVWFTAEKDSCVSDVLRVAADEWGLEIEDLELSYAGNVLSETLLLAAHGVECNAELFVSRKQFRTFGKTWFTNKAMKKRMLKWHIDNKHEHLYLETPEFIENNSLVFLGDLLPTEVKSISFQSTNVLISSLADGFLSYSRSLTGLDLSSLDGVTEIGSHFLCNSPIAAVNLSCLCDTSVIGSNFFHSSSITELDLSTFKNVTTFGSYFLCSCVFITKLDLPVACDVTGIEDGFLSMCTSLKSINLSGLFKVCTIGDYFLSGCSSLEPPDLSMFTNVTAVGSDFLSNCFFIGDQELSNLCNISHGASLTLMSHFNDA